jgi:hypothetical protein
VNFPEDRLRRFQRPAGVGDLNGFVGGHFAAVPQITFVLGEQFRRRCGENFISRLFLAALAAFNRPKQAWVRRVNSQRVDGIFAAQIRG